MATPLESHPPLEAGPRAHSTKRGPRQLIARTLNKAWDCNIFSEGAEAAFWQTLSLPPLLLGLLGCLGFLGDWFGQGVVTAVKDDILKLSETVFSRNVVDTIINPTVSDILTTAHSEIASVGFLISLWAGSSAMSSFVDAITVAHDQYGVRNEALQRIFALFLYIIGLVVAVIGLPVLAVGPEQLPHFFPESWRDTVSTIVNISYYPVVGALIVIALTTLYKVALPRKLPWHRGLPGAFLAMLIFFLASIGLRIYISWITSTGYTYGALAAPIAFLLFTFFIGLAITAGAYFNASIQEMWPAGMTRRQRRKWRRLGMERTAERIATELSRDAWLPAPDPLGRGPAPTQTHSSRPEPATALDATATHPGATDLDGPAAGRPDPGADTTLPVRHQPAGWDIAPQEPRHATEPRPAGGGSDAGGDETAEQHEAPGQQHPAAPHDGRDEHSAGDQRAATDHHAAEQRTAADHHDGDQHDAGADQHGADRHGVPDQHSGSEQPSGSK